MNPQIETENFPNVIEIYKKWHRTGFISVSFWSEADKVIVEIGSIDPNNNNALQGATKCFIPLFQFLAYLRAEISGNISTVFDINGDNYITLYGGGRVNKPEPKIVSRVFQVSAWFDRKKSLKDPYARQFSCAHYEGEMTSEGGVVPLYDKLISRNTMKISLSTLAELFETLMLQAYTENVADVLAERNKFKNERK